MKAACMLLLIWTLALGSAGPSARAGSEQLEALRFDPFSRPDLESVGAPPVADVEDWRPVLMATLVAGAESMANLGGVILKLGEEAYGYRLLEVGPWEAVFERTGERIVLPLAREDGS